MNKVADIHYHPLEYYPPITNFLDLVSKSKCLKIFVFTTYNDKNIEEYKVENTQACFRFQISQKNDFNIVKLWNYMVFTMGTLYKLILNRPQNILYYESYSVLRVFLCFFFFGKRVQLFVHFHEYFSRRWYREIATLPIKMNHLLKRKYMFNRAMWISQTKLTRIRLFLDHPQKNIPIVKCMRIPIIHSKNVKFYATTSSLKYLASRLAVLYLKKCWVNNQMNPKMSSL